MESVLITDPEGIVPIEDEWRSLAESRDNAFVTPEWFRSWGDWSPGTATPLIAAARREDGSLAGVLPLVLDNARPRMIRFAGASFADRICPAAREQDEAEVAAACMAALDREGLGHRTLMLQHVDPERPWWRARHAGTARTRSEVVIRRSYELPYIRFEGMDWDDYLGSRSRNFRQQLRKRERNLNEKHQVELRTASAKSLDSDLERFFELHERRWEGRGHSSLDTPGAKESLSAFATAAQERGWLRLLLLEVDGAPVAAFLGWRIGETYTFYQSGFDPDWSGMSVGIVMMARTIRSAIEEGASEFDMLLGSEAYKKRFQNASREVQTVALTSRAPTRLLLTAEANARRVGHQLADRIGEGKTTRLLRRLLPTSRRL